MHRSASNMRFAFTQTECVILHTGQSRQWDTVVSSTCSKRVMERGARPPKCSGTSSLPSSCLDINDVLAPRAHRWMSFLTQLHRFLPSKRRSSQLDQKERNKETSDLSNRPAPPSCNDKSRVDGILGVLGTDRGQQCKSQRLRL